jgi:cytochrome c oxidase accessory protein FixG
MEKDKLKKESEKLLVDFLEPQNSNLKPGLNFRDSFSNIDEKGKRIWIYPKKPKGKFHNLRIWVTVVLLGLLFTGPFLRYNDQPFLLFNVFERKFILFGMIFWPQDFHLLFLATLTFFVFIVLFTAIFGRVWCGWACPQTLFMEMVFRKIEYWIEGDMNQQRQLAKAPWNKEKIFKKGSKHFIFILIAILIAHTLMAYLIGVDQVINIVSQSPADNLNGFLGLLIFAGIFYFVFTYLREQACTVICPYGRLQSVLLAKETIVVAYNWIRGEPRGKLKKQQPVTPVLNNLGDCIDCKLCVQVCPTGIDIRNGGQMECVNCTACIDACDDVMTKIEKPKGLIRFDSLTGIEEKKKFKLNTRIIAYSAILTFLIGLLTTLLLHRTEIETTVLRVPGMLYQMQPHDKVSNLYNFQIVNKTFKDLKPTLKVEDAKGEIKIVGGRLNVPKNKLSEGTFFIELPKSEIKTMKTKLVIEVFNNGKLIDKVKTNFLGPAN